MHHRPFPDQIQSPTWQVAAISHIGLWEQHKGLMVKWMRGMGAVGEIWIWRKALTMGLAGR